MPQENDPHKPAQEPGQDPGGTGSGAGGKGGGKDSGNRERPQDGDRPPQIHAILHGVG